LAKPVSFARDAEQKPRHGTADRARKDGLDPQIGAAVDPG
jgi:hypothetical protein